MKTQNILILSIAFTALIIGSFATFMPPTAEASEKGKKKLSACEIARAKLSPAVAAFKKEFLIGKPFNAAAVYQNIRRSPSIDLAKEKFRALDPDQRRQVWNNKLAYLVQSSEFNDFTKTQQALILRVKDEVLPSVDFSRPAVDGEHQALKDELLAAFRASDMRSIFASLSTAEAVLPASALQQQSCTCKTIDAAWWSCPDGWFCDIADCRIVYGCGIFWIWICEGICKM